MRVFGLAGWSGSGKTTLMTLLLPALIGRGIAVSTVKHAHHDFDVDEPGKDSYTHRQAGAREVMIASARRWALMHELREEPEPRLETLIRHMTPVDLLLVEGFKREPHSKLEVYRASLGKPLLATDDPKIVAVASDNPVAGLAVPCFLLSDIDAIASFIITRCGIEARIRGSTQR
jgi:molybdopterin-guanine dinucleotide biosynthesis adapter protein